MVQKFKFELKEPLTLRFGSFMRSWGTRTRLLGRLHHLWLLCLRLLHHPGATLVRVKWLVAWGDRLLRGLLLILIVIYHLIRIALLIWRRALIAHKELVRWFWLRFLVQHWIIGLSCHDMDDLLLALLRLRKRLMIRDHEAHCIVLWTVLRSLRCQRLLLLLQFSEHHLMILFFKPNEFSIFISSVGE